MKFFISKKIILISIACLVFFILDRVLKYLAAAGKIFYHQNSGIAFSINVPEFISLYLYIFISLILILIVWHLIKSIKNSYWLLAISYWLLFLGAVSNLLDRIKFGYIIDYLNFGFFYNNLADVMICGGVGILVLSLVIRQISDK